MTSADRLLVVASGTTTAVRALATEFSEVLVVLPDPSGWPSHERFDRALIVGLGPRQLRAQGVLSSVLDRVDPGSQIGIAVVPGQASGQDEADWQELLEGLAFRGTSMVAGTLFVNVAAAGGTDPPAASYVTGAMLAGGSLEAGEPPPALPDRPSAAGADGSLEELRTRLHDLELEHAALRTRYRNLRRSRPVGWSTRLRRASPRSLGVGRVFAALAVVLAAAIGVVAALGASSWALGAATALIVLVLLLLLGRQEQHHRRIQRQLLAGRRRDRQLRESSDRTAESVHSLSHAFAAERRAGTLAREQVATTVVATVDAARAVAELRTLTAELVAAADSRQDYSQVQAALNLFGQLRPGAPVPPMRGAAASPDVIELVVGELTATQPSLVLECGSGVSTLWLALAVQRHGLSTRIVSLDHDEQHVARTRAVLDAHGVGQLVEVRHARLAPSGLEGHQAPWYEQSALADLEAIGLVFIDGPPGVEGTLSRYPAVPLLHSRLAATAVLILDDADRTDERSALAAWSREFPDLSVELVATEEGAAILRRA